MATLGAHHRAAKLALEGVDNHGPVTGRVLVPGLLGTLLLLVTLQSSVQAGTLGQWG